MKNSAMSRNQRCDVGAYRLRKKGSVEEKHFMFLWNGDKDCARGYVQFD